jgi:hypothetical protein
MLRRRSAGQSVLEQSTHLGLMTRSLLLSDICGFVDLGHPLWRVAGSVVYICYWPSPAQSFLGPSPIGLVWPYFTVSDSRLPYSSPPPTRRVTVEVFDPASTRGSKDTVIVPDDDRLSVEQSVEWESAEETEVLAENLPQCQFAHHNCHIFRPGIEHGSPQWEAGDCPLSCGAVHEVIICK